MPHKSYKEEIAKALDSIGVQWSSPKCTAFHTSHDIAGHKVNIIGQLPEGFPTVPPNFVLDNRSSFGQLAHVGWNPTGEYDFGTICYRPSDAVDLDPRRPGDVYLESLEKSVNILKNSLTDTEYNQAEILNEFMAVWRAHDINDQKIIVCAEPKINSVSKLIVRYPNKQKETNKSGIETQVFAYSEPSSVTKTNYLYKEAREKSARRNEGKSILISVESLLPPPPPFEPVEKWWKAQLIEFSDVIKKQFKEYKKLRSKVFYVFLHTTHNDNPIWLGIKFEASNKTKVPLCVKNIQNWSASICSVNPISRGVLIPRSAGQISLQDKTVCIVGCGSVGHQIATLLVKVGIGNLLLIDHDNYHFENIHKHSLPLAYLDKNKALALKWHIEHNHPFVKVEAINSKLTTDRIEDVLNVDIVVLATGNPVIEREIDHKIREKNDVKAVISAWNEPYGIGGHVQLSHLNTKGCLTCTFTDPSSEELSIGNNWLNFTTPDQKTLENIGGCGFEFIAFNAIDASKTSTLAAELVQKFLSGEINKSIALSWRGSDKEFIKRRLTTTHRYQATKEHILSTEELYTQGCKNCIHE